MTTASVATDRETPPLVTPQLLAASACATQANAGPGPDNRRAYPFAAARWVCVTPAGRSHARP